MPSPTILLWRLGALGDSLLLLPALAALRAVPEFANHKIVAAGAHANLAPARWAGLADAFVDASAPGLAPLSSGQPAGAGLLPPDIAVAVVWSARHAEIAEGLARMGIARVVAAPALPPDRTPVVDHYLTTLAPLGVRPIAYTGRRRGGGRAPPPGAGGPPTAGATGPVALLHPGAGSRLKRWPLAHYLALARMLRADGTTVTWTTGPADDKSRAALIDAGEGQRLLPPLDVAGLAAVLARASVVVSADCGVAHLTALLAVPSVVLFGPTDARLWGPPGPRTTVLHLALPCAPCGDLAPRCPSRICLRGLSVAAVYDAVQAHMRDENGATGATDDGNARGAVSAGTALWRGPSRPAVSHPPAPAPAPPAPLRVATWARARTWAARSSREPG